MFKTYCDSCGKEISRNFVTDRFKPELRLGGHKFKAEVLVNMDNIWNNGDLCKKCLLLLLASREASK